MAKVAVAIFFLLATSACARNEKGEDAPSNIHCLDHVERSCIYSVVAQQLKNRAASAHCIFQLFETIEVTEHNRIDYAVTGLQKVGNAVHHVDLEINPGNCSITSRESSTFQEKSCADLNVTFHDIKNPVIAVPEALQKCSGVLHRAGIDLVNRFCV